MSWAGLRGAVPIVLATIPLTQGLRDTHRIFDVVFLLVVAFTLVQAPTLPWVAHHFPQPAVEAVGSAVQAVAPVVGADPDLTPLEIEAAPGDPIGIRPIVPPT